MKYDMNADKINTMPIEIEVEEYKLHHELDLSNCSKMKVTSTNRKFERKYRMKKLKYVKELRVWVILFINLK